MRNDPLSGTVVVDFTADWCAPCKTFGPMLAELMGAEANMEFVTVNVDDDPSYAAKHQVQSVPTVLAFRDGVVIDRFTGAKSKNAVRQWLANL